MTDGMMTVGEAAELIIEAILEGLEGCDENDTDRPEAIIRTLETANPWKDYGFPHGVTAGELRGRLLRARAALAREVSQ